MGKRIQKQEAVVLVTDEKAAAKDLTQRYQEVDVLWKGTLTASIRFGIVYGKYAAIYGATGLRAEGQGMKSWMEKHCPEINYNSARAYKLMGDRAIKMLGGSEDAVQSLLGNSEFSGPGGETIDVPAEYIEKAKDLFAEAKSRRKFEQMYFDFSGNGWGGKREGAGAKFKGQADVAAELEAIGKSEALAWKAAYGALETLANLRRKKDLFHRLNDDHLATASGLLADLAKASAEALEARLGGAAK